MIESRGVTCEPETESMVAAFIDWFNDRVADFDCPKLSRREVYIVWFCYIVGNAKILLSTTRPDHMYYEVTYHSENNQIHIDAYKKFVHESIDLIESNHDDSDSDNKSQDMTKIFNDMISSMFKSFI